jgi:hypothetical protein
MSTRRLAAVPAAANSPLKKGTGSEPPGENPAKNGGREVPVPFFNGLLNVLGAKIISSPASA